MLNREERVKLVTETLGHLFATEVYQAIDNVDPTLLEAVPMEHVSGLLTVQQCKAQFWKEERYSPKAAAMIKLIEEILLQGRFYTPERQGLQIQPAKELFM